VKVVPTVYIKVPIKFKRIPMNRGDTKIKGDVSLPISGTCEEVSFEYDSLKDSMIKQLIQEKELLIRKNNFLLLEIRKIKDEYHALKNNISQEDKR
jgi:hypothetical protein